MVRAMGLAVARFVVRSLGGLCCSVECERNSSAFRDKNMGKNGEPIGTELPGSGSGQQNVGRPQPKEEQTDENLGSGVEFRSLLQTEKDIDVMCQAIKKQ